jgi:hypothetical protein
MSNYTKTTNFASKDNLSPGNPLKIVKGTEIDTEFNNIQTAVGTKTDNASANITGGTITGITDLAVADGGTGASTASAALNNLLPSQTSAANKYLQSDGTNASWDAVSLSTADITGTLPVANGGTGVTTSTGTTNVVLSNSPTLVTPALGTPSAAVLTNATGLPLTTGVTGTLPVANGGTGITSLGTGVATFLGTPSSANLRSALTDETGTGSAVFATSPTLVTPALGTPSALVGTNITGTASGLTAGTVTTNANLTGMVTSVGNATTVVTNANLTGAVTSSGNATSLGSFSSANLLAALTDETGTGSAVFATSPTLVTPILGTPTSATLTNATGLPLSTGVTGQLPVANGGTGTATPSIVAGTNVTVTGTWPNQTIAASGGGGTPGGSTTQVQYNNAGAFGGITGATTDGTSLTLVAPILGTPASGTVTNLTGTASININGTVGATTASTGAFTTLTTSSTVTHNGGTANGVTYLNGSKVLTSGSALTFDGTNLGVGIASAVSLLDVRDGVGSILTLGNTGNFAAGEFSRIKWQEGSTQLADIGWEADSNELRINNRVASTSFYAANAEGMRLTSTGLGIGTTAPVTKAHFVATSAGAIATQLTVQNASDSTGTGANIDFIGLASSAIPTGSVTNVRDGAGAYSLRFSTFGSSSNAERMRIDASGNLGLGTAPSAWGSGTSVIDLNTGGSAGAVASSGTLSIANNGFFNGTNWIYKNSSTALTYQLISGQHRWNIAASGTAGNTISFTQAMTLDASGNLGVGVTPSANQGRIQANGSGQSWFKFYDSSTGWNFGTFYKANGTSPLAYMGAGGGNAISGATVDDFAIRAEGAFVIATGGGTERARINLSGTLLVGQTDGSMSTQGILLEPYGTGRFVTNGGADNVCMYLNRIASDGSIEIFQRNNSTVGSISVTTTATAYNTSSDYRLKNTIAPMTGALAKVALLKPVTYKWNANGSDGEGFIAHELAEVVPHAVTGAKDAVDEDGKPVHQGIDVSFLVATLTAAIQEQQALITQLQADVATLKGN